MKKWMIGMLVFLLLFSFVACSQGNSISAGKKSSGVPDQYLRMDVEDYIYEEELDGDYTFTATHNYDKASAVDRVTISLVFAYEFGTETYTGTCNYQFDKSANNWSKIGSVRWGDPKEALNEQAYEKNHSGSTLGMQWTVDVRDLDLQNNTITCDIELVNSSGAVYRTDGYYTYSLHSESFDLVVLGVTYNVYLGVNGIFILQEW